MLCNQMSQIIHVFKNSKTGICPFSFIIWYNILGEFVLYSKSIFKIQKRIIRFITAYGRRDSCSELLRQLNILLLQSQYITTLLLFIIKNMERFLSISEV